MATIAMQRGSSAITANTPLTLWTQSGGSATKVIFNQLMVYDNAGGNVGGMHIQLSYYPSGGYASQIAYLYNPHAIVSVQMDPVLGSKPQAFYNSNSTSAQSGAQWMYGNVSSTPIGQSVNANGVYVRSAPYGPGEHICPPSFYVGPSDVVKFTCSIGGASKIVSWSFTTITEA